MFGNRPLTLLLRLAGQVGHCEGFAAHYRLTRDPIVLLIAADAVEEAGLGHEARQVRELGQYLLSLQSEQD